MIENHVVNLAFSKRLKELGVKQESEFYWVKVKEDGEYFIARKGNIAYHHATHKVYEMYSAFLSSEIGEILPSEIVWEIGKEERQNFVIPRPRVLLLPLNVRRYPHFWMISYSDTSTNPEFRVFGHEEYAETEADARAKMLIYLIKNSIIDVKSL